MLTWVMYDISITKSRDKVVKFCKQAGIYRVQKSVFLGELNPAQRKELNAQIEDVINKKTDSVYIFPMCRDDFKNCILLGQAFDKKLITNEIKAFFV